MLYSIALILTVYVSLPLMEDISNRLSANPLDFSSLDKLQSSANVVKEPVKAHLMRYAKPAEREFFLSATARIWPPETRANVKDDDFIILLPAFVSSELTRAFEIGFLLFLPFLVIDIIVSNILMAMGMMMVSPTADILAAQAVPVRRRGRLVAPHAWSHPELWVRRDAAH